MAVVVAVIFGTLGFVFGALLFPMRVREEYVRLDQVRCAALVRPLEGCREAVRPMMGDGS